LESGRKNTVSALYFDSDRGRTYQNTRRRERRRTRIKSEKIYVERKREEERKTEDTSALK